jgi:polysaccharide biosynthesis/export protein
MMRTFYLLVLCSLFFFSSCATRRTLSTIPAIDTTPVFRDTTIITSDMVDTSLLNQSRKNNYLVNQFDQSGTIASRMPEPRIQRDDILHIKVFSQTTDPKLDIPYNLIETGGAGGSSVSPATGFLVDNNGNIEYPVIGTIHVQGLTKEELAKTIKERLEKSLKNPSVIVRFLNYKVTVLGEVKNPSTYTTPTDRITILDALGLAGDVTEFGDRSKVKVARENNGQYEIGFVDLTNASFFTSPYFRLKQNDIVFVEPTEQKYRAEQQEYRKEQRDILQQKIQLRQEERQLKQDERQLKEQQRQLKQEERQSIAQQISLISGIITGIALILNLIR